MDHESREWRPVRFAGGRFETEGEPGFPLEVLSELTRYEELLIRVATGIWKNENPNRERAPRGFKEDLRLQISSVEGGSVIPVLEPRSVEREDEMFPESWIERSQDVIAGAAEAATNGQPLPETFPADAIPFLLRFGKSFRSDEKCFLSNGQPDRVAYDQSARRHLVRLVQGNGASEIEVEGELIGTISAINADENTFGFRDRLAGNIEGQFEDQALFAEIKARTEPDDDAPFVRLECRYLSGQEGVPTRIENVEGVETIVTNNDPLGPQLREILDLSAGWHDGNGETVEVGAVESVGDFVAELAPETVSRLSVFPSLAGGVLVETQEGTNRWSLEIPASGPIVVATLINGDFTEDEIGKVEEAGPSLNSFLS